MLSLILGLINLVLLFLVFVLFKTITDNLNDIIIILRDEVIQLNNELQVLRGDRK